MCPSIDNSDSDDIHPLSHGCLDRSFLETEDVVKLLTTYSESEAHDIIPEGSKNNVYFVIKNSGNTDKRSRGQQSSFSDDCGVWDTNKGSSHNKTEIYLVLIEYPPLILKILQCHLHIIRQESQ